MKKILYLLCVLVISCQSEKKDLVTKVLLDEGWQFKYTHQQNEKWLPAVVPGTIHTDLLNNKLIPDPFYGCNEKDLQWIGQTPWQYRNTFWVDPQLLDYRAVQLVFEGLDTYADVFLNGQKVISAHNMFREWRIDCKSLLHPGENLLEITFHSAENKFFEDSLALGYPLPGGRWVFARKAAYHFGWDWGPAFITAGIWKPVRLEAYNDHDPRDIQLFTTDIQKHKAIINSTWYIHSAKEEKAWLKVRDLHTNQILSQEQVLLQPGKESHTMDITIDNPRLWWTHDLGDPHLYDLEFELVTHSGFHWKKNIPYGIRTIEVVTEPDQYGESFYLKINDIPVFMKGANYIPQHSFVTEVTDEDYHHIISNALKSNFNMLRIWGGGIYEKDLFYELCDQYGILVWQDFMFACAMYPGDDAYVENVKQEATEQILRLRNHASLAMWCGNNEVDEGWKNWQWQATHGITPNDSTTIWQNYQRVFHHLLPELVEALDPGRFYLHTSPVHGWGHEESMTEGTAHYWGVWWGVQPFEMYLEKVPRFMSEFGFQAMPAMATIRQFQPSSQNYLFSESLACHQKHPTGYQTISTYLEWEHLFPKTLQEFIYGSQLIQAKGVGMAIEAQRTSQPRCMGTLYWQFNDCWPVTSWAGMDVNGNWKALQYEIRKLYDQIMVSILEHQDSLKVNIVSGLLHEQDADFTVSLVDFEHNRITLFDNELTLAANQPNIILSLPAASLRSQYDFSHWMIEGVLETSCGKKYQNQKFLKPLGLLDLPKAQVSWETQKTQDGYLVKLESSAFAPFIQLYLDDSHAWFEDNFFHLWPDSPKTVFCRTDLSQEAFEAQMRVFFLNKKITQ